MKRTKFIMLVVVVALVLMGAGYAAWTQVFTIDSTVSTGELFVQVVNTDNTYEVVDADGNRVSGGDLDTDNDYLDLKVTSKSDGEGERQTLTELSFNLNNMYPGTRQTSKIEFKNLGTLKTITAFNNLAIDPSGGNALWNDLVIEVNGNRVADGNNAGVKLENLAEAIRDAVGELEPGGSADVTIVQELPFSSENETEDLSLKWTVPLEFRQYNATQAE